MHFSTQKHQEIEDFLRMFFVQKRAIYITNNDP